MNARPRVVIVGGGFGGIECAKALRRAPCEVLLVDRRNHHTFQPLLYQVATAVLAPSDVGYPIRRIFRRDPHLTVALGEVVSIDVEARTLTIRGGSSLDEPPRTIRYDTLVLAAGANTFYFGHDEWSALAPSLKTLEDAVTIRARILEVFEMAEIVDDEAARRWLLTFVVVGGGPTGVELAGAIKELAVDALSRDFRRIDTTTARVVLVEGGDRILPAMDPPLSESAKRTLERLGVEVRVSSLVTAVDERGISIGSERLDASNVIWAAGVRASPLGSMLGAETDGAGRVRAGADLSIPAHPEVFVVGDMARVEQHDGSIVPGVAPAAMQMGRFVGRVIRDRLRGRAPPDRFRYRDKGSLATIGRSAAVAKVAGIRFRGFLAWFLWGAIHLTFLVGFRNRVVTMFSWFLSYVFFSKGSRLITAAPSPPPAHAPPASIGGMSNAASPLVGIIMGSQSDWETMRHAAEVLEQLGVPSESRVVSAHRTPDQLFEYASSAAGRGVRVIIAGAGGAAHLPGMCASKTHLPVLGVPVESRALHGLDSLLSIIQMPGGIPVGTLAIGAAGAKNAGLLAAAIIALADEGLRARLIEWRSRQTTQVLAQPDPTASSSGGRA